MAVRLTYFQGYGLAEQLRWTMAAAGIEWEQVALSQHAQFAALRDGGSLLFGQLPLLEIDGLKLTQSQAMVRYVARRAGLTGKGPAEEALVDMVCEAVKDARGPVVGYPFQDRRAVEAELPRHFAKLGPRFESILASNVRFAEAPGILASGLTVADVLLGELAEEMVQINGRILDPYPRLAAVRQRVLQLPGVAAYLASNRRFPFPKDDRVAREYVANVSTVLGR
eukprot:TRINITY_DN23207_c0_g1_i1.p1 TRINITY_DN23207_c0_g1~~TRINITY_DN23207_c0_g1_i1.p1  ORF type:complete len:225 (+),score=47.13 TRINITY_DN23207_c0_g1_i1:49-723(+)